MPPKKAGPAAPQPSKPTTPKIPTPPVPDTLQKSNTAYLFVNPDCQKDAAFFFICTQASTVPVIIDANEAARIHGRIENKAVSAGAIVEEFQRMRDEHPNFGAFATTDVDLLNSSRSNAKGIVKRDHTRKATNTKRQRARTERRGSLEDGELGDDPDEEQAAEPVPPPKKKVKANDAADKSGGKKAADSEKSKKDATTANAVAIKKELLDEAGDDWDNEDSEENDNSEEF